GRGRWMRSYYCNHLGKNTQTSKTARCFLLPPDLLWRFSYRLITRNLLASDRASQISYIKCGIVNSQMHQWPRLWCAVSISVYRTSCLVLASRKQW
ncbi:mCG17766, isoform CRA_a, partial [Mus musculus]